MVVVRPFPKNTGLEGTAGEAPVEAVKIAPRTEQGSVKIRVTVLKGRLLETQMPVGITRSRKT